MDNVECPHTAGIDLHFIDFGVMNNTAKNEKGDFYMEIRYNVTGDRRKALVQAIADITGARPVYKFMPTCNYEIGCFTVTKDGTLIFDDRTDSVEAEKVLDGIAAAGFECEAPQGADSGDTAASSEDAGELPTEPQGATVGAESADTAASSEDAGELPAGLKGAVVGADTATLDVLTVSLPKDGFDADALERLRKLVESKASLIKKALGAERLTILPDGDKVSFPWWDTLPEPEETQAFTAFIAALCRMAKEAKRVTATEKAVDSEKYAFRGFLLRLGFIGAECKDQRKLLLKNLSGSAAFPNKAKADAFSAAQKAKRDAAKAPAAETDSAGEVTA